MSGRRRRIRKTQRQRRMSAKTNYSTRLKLLKAGVPRIVVRRTGARIIGQLVTSHEAQDSVRVGVSSQALLSQGWPKEAEGSLATLPAAYLTGYLLGKKMHAAKQTGNVILDIGMHRNIHKSRLYAFAKGLVDSGISLSVDENVFPDEGRIEGAHLKREDVKKSFSSIKSKIDKL